MFLDSIFELFLQVMQGILTLILPIIPDVMIHVLSIVKKSLLWYWTFSLQILCALCVGCDIVQADHAPEAGVAQGIFHGILVRHHGRIQEEVEEGLEDEVERHKEEENTQEQVRMPMTMDGSEDTQTRLASKDGAQRTQNYALFASVCIVVFMQLVAMCSRLLKLCVKMYAVFRSLCVS